MNSEQTKASLVMTMQGSALNTRQDVHSQEFDLNCWQPIIFENGCAEDGLTLNQLYEQGKIWSTCDTLQRQLLDLQVALHPKLRDTPMDAARLAAWQQELQEIQRGPIDRWVVYPWSGSAVRVLAPKLYNRLRLDRNRNKITAAEQACLAEQTVGIVGLSVGNAIALSLAMEGLCGHLKLTDMDTIDLSNMNRLRVRVDEIGLHKTVVAARQVFELNPYASLSIFSEGIHEGNIEEFLVGDRKLDILVEECDNIRLKFQLRELASRHRIPVIMETSDRGMLDVERFDVQPDLEPFHGLCAGIQSAQIPHSLSHEDKVVFALPILDSSTVSPRMAASMIDVDESLSTWPQLGSEVALGGASVAAAVRQIGLRKPMTSGRRFVDLQALLATEPNARLAAGAPGHGLKSLENETEKGSEKPSPVDAQIRELVHVACLAPSGGNSQPWRFFHEGKRLWLTLDRQRAHNSFDPYHRGALLAMGAAIRNMELAASHRHWRLKRVEDATCNDCDCIASYMVDGAERDSPRVANPLFNFINKRVTNRGKGTGAPLENGLQRQLIEVAADGQCNLQLLDDAGRLSELAEIVGECDRLRFLNETLNRELVAEVRWSRLEASQRRDGLDLEALQLKPSEIAGLRMLRRPEVAAGLRETGGGNALKDTARNTLASASAVGLLSIDNGAAQHVVQAGKTFQSLWLFATSRGLSLHPMTAAIYMFQVAHDQCLFSERERRLLADLQERFHAILPIGDGHIPLMLFRLSQGVGPATIRALRRPIEDVLLQGPPTRGVQS
ncbi:MAG: Rv1355c family protein [Planctomycetales bacterium]|nr:Rv1355c family protein [Planctomycetales bacterium]